MCLYSLGATFSITFPPKSYPPTAPYASLTSHLKKLVKNGLIKSFLVKALLYPQILADVDTSSVTLRKRKKSSLYVTETNSNDSYNEDGDHSQDNNLTDSSICDSENDKHTDDNDDSSCCSFGFVRFKTGKLSDAKSNDFDDYEEIDFKNQSTSLNPSTGRKSSITIDRSPDGSFIFSNSNVNINLNDQRDSLPIYSKPIQTAPNRTPSRERSIVHTSMARLNITALKSQRSEASEMSADFGKRIDCTHMACEDLVNIDDTTAITSPLLKKPLLDERHSMPTLFVGNRFNSSATTKVYIPSYSDKKNIKLTTENVDSAASNDDEDINSVTTHSSSIDVAAVVPASDEITAELLYNFTAFNSRENSDIEPEIDNCLGAANIIKPPSMFDNRCDRISLSREHSPFLKHSLNSDKKCAAKMYKAKDASEDTPRANSIKRCISYQFVNLMYDMKQKKDDDSSDCVQKKCACCASSKCPSPRSSDSGMAGSCTISSPDPPVLDNHFDAEFDGRPANRLSHSRSSHNFGRCDVDFVNPNNHDSGQFGETSLLKYDEHGSQSEANILELSTSRETVKRKTRSHSAERSQSHVNAIYKTGLYAHWWKKENLPKAMLQNLVLLKHSRDNERKRIGWGSGKIECDFSFVCFILILVT